MKMAGFQVLSPRANPPVKDRVNSVNRLLREGRLTVDGSCKYTIMDLEQNVWRNQQIDTRDPEHGHMLDALGYGCSCLCRLYQRLLDIADGKFYTGSIDFFKHYFSKFYFFCC